jgi:16S rRNA (adenine1518-N6/adenine1519-N6)-dimethyltransferase
LATRGKRRSLGQHFLIDQKVCSTIAAAALKEAESVQAQALLEIGPGKGAITEHLLAHPVHPPLRIVEKDYAFADHWKSKIGPQGPTEVICADFTDLKTEDWLQEERLVVASNLPYSAGTAIFTLLAEQWRRVPALVLMFQKEVAERLLARPSTADRGSLSVWTQNLWDVEKLIHVPPRAFRPPPEVDSMVVICRARGAPRIPDSHEGKGAELWQKFLKLAFTHRRKMLRSGLPSTGPWKAALEKSGVDPTLRPEALDWPEWEKLFRALTE